MGSGFGLAFEADERLVAGGATGRAGLSGGSGSRGPGCFAARAGCLATCGHGSAWLKVRTFCSERPTATRSIGPIADPHLRHVLASVTRRPADRHEPWSTPSALASATKVSNSVGLVPVMPPPLLADQPLDPTEVPGGRACRVPRPPKGGRWPGRTRQWTGDFLPPSPASCGTQRDAAGKRWEALRPDVREADSPGRCGGPRPWSRLGT